MRLRYAMMTLTAALLAACNTAPRPVAQKDESPIRDSALHFTHALRTADTQALQQLTTAESDPEVIALSQKVIADAIKARQVQAALQQQFGEMETRPGICGSDAWMAQFENTAAHEPIMQAGNRVRIGEAGKAGTFFLRDVGGKWKVEVVPTLLAETGGRAKTQDPTLHYRVGVTLAVNAWMLERLERGEFASMHDYMAAKTRFWFQYMAYAGNGDDPRDKLLPSLPPLPAETDEVTEDR